MSNAKKLLSIHYFCSKIIVVKYFFAQHYYSALYLKIKIQKYVQDIKTEQNLYFLITKRIIETFNKAFNLIKGFSCLCLNSKKKYLDPQSYYPKSEHSKLLLSQFQKNMQLL